MRPSIAALGLILLIGSSGLVLAAGSTATAGLVTTVQSATMTDAQIQQKLQSEGYTDVRITEHDSGHINVLATRNRKAEKLVVNPQTGAAMPDNDDDND
jgi:preprotein translocase subunit SecF